MTTISPTRVSMYDFLYHDTKPMLSLLADAAQLSLPQTRLGMDASLQAIVSALLVGLMLKRFHTVLQVSLRHEHYHQLAPCLEAF